MPDITQEGPGQVTRGSTHRHLRLARPEDADRAAALARIRAVDRRVGAAADYQLVAGDPVALDALGAHDTVRLHERLSVPTEPARAEQ